MLLTARHEDGSPMSRQELRDELMTALVAGHETTASQLAWGLERLAREPAVVEPAGRRARRRRQRAYLDATINEILRLRPVLPNAEPRLVKQEVEIGGVRYPPGVVLMASVYLIQHDPEIYPDPYAFRPERFLGAPPRAPHVAAVRRRPPALPRRELRPAGDEDRAARRARAVRADAGAGAARDDPAAGDHLQPDRRRDRRAERARGAAGTGHRPSRAGLRRGASGSVCRRAG